VQIEDRLSQRSIGSSSLCRAAYTAPPTREVAHERSITESSRARSAAKSSA